MPVTKLSDLTSAGSLASGDLFYVVQTAGVGGKKATLSQLATLLGSSFLGLTAQAADSAKLGGTAAASFLLASTAASTYQTQSGMSAYQLALVSGTSIKTVGGVSLLGSGDVSVGGGGDMLLGTAQEVTAAKTFDVSTLLLKGSTSGTSTLNAAAVAGTTTFTLPGSSGTLALLSDIPSLSGYETTSHASSTYQTLAGMSGYLTTSGTAADSSKLGGTAAASYLLASTAASTYLAVGATAADSSKLGGVSAASYALTSDLSPYLTSATAASTYQTQAGMSSYLTTASAASTYLALSGGTLTGGLTLSGTSLTFSGNISAPAWTTAGIRHKSVSATLTDTTSSGTVAAAYTNTIGGNTIAASNATTFTDYATLYLDVPTAGSNVTITNPWSLYATGAARVVGLTSAGTATITPAANTNALAVTGYSLTGSNATSMVNLAGTWNTSGRPTGIKLNVTNTASAANSRLLDVQIGGTSVFNVDTYSVNVINKLQIQSTPDSSTYTYISYDRLNLGVNAYLSWGSTTAAAGSADTYVYRDAAGILAQRNGANAQTLRVYNTYTDASNYERGVFDWNTTANTLRIGYEKSGSGADRDVTIVGSSGGKVKIQTAGVTYNIAGAIYPSANVSNDLGQSSERFRSLLLGQSLTGSSTTGAIDIATTWNTSGTPSLINIAVTDTASNAASMLIKATVGAATVFGVDKTGKPTFGTHSALAAETVTGYITIVDAGGTTRKLAVVS